MLDPVVHAALVTVFTFLVNLLFALIGIDLGGEVATGLATVIVGYILSLFGLSLLRKADRNNIMLGPDKEYKPPFT